MRESLTPHQRFYFQQVRATAAQSLEAEFDRQLLAHDVQGVVSDFKFHPSRGWEVDRAVPGLKVAVEIQGGTRGALVQCHSCHQTVLHQGRSGRWIPVRQGLGHSTGVGIQRDIEKLNALQEMGWLCAYLTGDMIEDGTGIVIFKKFLELRTNLTPLP